MSRFVLLFLPIFCFAGETLYPSPKAHQLAKKVFEANIINDNDAQTVIKTIKDAVANGNFRVTMKIKSEKSSIILDYLWGLGYNIKDKQVLQTETKFTVEWK